MAAEIPVLVDSADTLRLTALLGELNGTQLLPAKEVQRISDLLKDLSILSEVQMAGAEPAHSESTL